MQSSRLLICKIAGLYLGANVFSGIDIIDQPLLSVAKSNDSTEFRKNPLT